MKKFLSTILVLFGALLSASAVSFAATLNMYEQPDVNSKIVASLEKGKQLIPIFYTDKKDWVKVANPQNGDVGWVKVNELKGPMIITQVNGSKIQQQVVTTKDDKGKEPTVYSIIQYSGPQELKPEEAEKAVKEMERRHENMRNSMQKMQEDMQKYMRNMFKDFDKSFYTFPVIQPIIVVPESNKESKNKK